jgi:hypothetical protein
MNSSARTLAASCVVALIAAMATGCGGPPKVESAKGERLPANGAPGVAASALPSKSIARDEWEKLVGERIKPTCDSKEGVRTADAGNLEGAGKIIGTWTQFSSTKAKSRTGDGKVVGEGKEPTRTVDSLGMTCAAGGSTLQVNGVLYPFDVAWVKTGKGKAKTLDGSEGAGEFAMIQALSYKDKRVVFAKVYVPSDANDDTDDTVIISSLANYLPENPDEPVVRVVSDREDPKFETFVFSKGETEGLSFQVPQQDALGRARFLSVGTFEIAGSDLEDKRGGRGGRPRR